MRSLISSLAALTIVLVAAQPAAATFPGREGRLGASQVQGFERTLVTFNVDGSDARRVMGDGFSPRWSAGGRKLAWSTFDSVFVADGDGSNPRRVTSQLYFMSNIAISPDGRTLVVTRELPRNRRNWIREDLVLVDVATGRERVLTYDAGSPAFSPDGKWVAFVDMGVQNRQGRYRDIGIVRTNGRDRRVVYRSARNRVTSSPDWSPTGATIAFGCSGVVGGHYRDDLCLVGVRSGRMRVLARGVAFGAWSPTGRRILVSGDDGSGGATEAMAVPSGGGTPTPLGWQGHAEAWQPLPR